MAQEVAPAPGHRSGHAAEEFQPYNIVLSFVGTNNFGSHMDAFTVRDLRERTGELIRDAEEGKLSLVTKHGQPVFIAVPFDEWVVAFGVRIALAMRLFEEEVVSVAQATKLAGIAEEEFLEKLAAASVAVARYSADELSDEMKVLQLQQKRSRYRVRRAKP